MARIVISEFMDERAVAQLEAAHDVLYDPKLVGDTTRLRAEAAKADALIVRNLTQVRGELLAALTRCKVVGRLGVGLDNIDVPACEAKGMKVIPATGANALSVAEYVIASTMLLLRGAFASSAGAGHHRLRLHRPADGAPGARPGHASARLRRDAGARRRRLRANRCAAGWT
jgi:(S)-sulfolactate dehydrogenase